MTRIDSVRAATDSAKESAQHAAEVVAPYADTAKIQAAHYANEARVRLAPKVSAAAQQARVQYVAHVAPRIDQALAHVPPKVDDAARVAVVRTHKAAKNAAGYTVPRFEYAVAAATPVAAEAQVRSAAALAALRGQVTAKDINRLAKKNACRAKSGRLFKGILVLSLVTAGACAAWRWWDRQANPDWLVEPSEPTAAGDAQSPLTSVDGTDLDTGIRTTQADAEAGDPNGKNRGDQP
ncbi:DUF5324 family protein [Streptomyces sp. NBC_00102]|uniref:DUF5324 family protein n=1 Tax=Streptomyces sp. NBC_00102 TaxID=2975652 RepID=UPI00225B4193|nr:DUF5324 family protein [Streptomyces sp. NBC_00102]MCX5398305.1 DUF5324 family protein [Streptomyces sp. NBC_00102]